MRRKQDEPKKGAPEWMNTYGDMVTLLLTFFIMLFAMSTLDAAKFQQIINSIQGSAGIKYSGESIMDDVNVYDNFEEDIKSEEPTDNVESIYMQVNKYITENDIGESIVLIKGSPGLLIRFTENVLFDSGKADLKPGAKEILKNMGAVFSKFDNYIRVEGHTDNVPIHNIRFEDNWDLSTKRAGNVVRFFISEGLPASKLSAAGYGQYRPVSDNLTHEGRQRNRRVDVVILRNEVVEQFSIQNYKEGDMKPNEQD